MALEGALAEDLDLGLVRNRDTVAAQHRLAVAELLGVAVGALAGGVHALRQLVLRAGSQVLLARNDEHAVGQKSVLQLLEVFVVELGGVSDARGQSDDGTERSIGNGSEFEGLLVGHCEIGLLVGLGLS